MEIKLELIFVLDFYAALMPIYPYVVNSRNSWRMQTASWVIILTAKGHCMHIRWTEIGRGMNESIRGHWTNAHYWNEAKSSEIGVVVSCCSQFISPAFAINLRKYSLWKTIPNIPKKHLKSRITHAVDCNSIRHQSYASSISSEIE